MSEITPYYNQQDWGRDLLKRLNKMSDPETGGFHVWSEYPVVGVDGRPLDLSHTGYTGWLKREQGKALILWDGQNWTFLADIPFNVQGEGSDPIASQYVGREGFALNNSYADGFIYVIIQAIATLTVTISKVNKTSLETAWTIECPHLATQAQKLRSALPLGNICKDGESAYIVLGFSDESVNTWKLVKLSDSSGVILWQVLTTSSSVGIDTTQIIVGDNLYSFAMGSLLRKRDKFNGTLSLEVDVSHQRAGVTGLSIGKLFLDAINNNLILTLQPQQGPKIPVIKVYDPATLTVKSSLDPISSLGESATVKGIVQHPSVRHLLILLVELIDGANHCWTYNASTGGLAYLSTFPAIGGRLVGVKSGDSFTPPLVLALGKSLVEATYDDGYKIKGPLFPGGEGDLIFVDGEASFEEFEENDNPLIRQAKLIRGYDDTREITLKITSSLINRQVVRWNGAAILFGEAKLSRAENSFADCHIIEAEILNSRQNYIAIAENLNGTYPSNQSSRKEAGIDLGNGAGHIFSLNGNVSANSGINIPENSSYTDGRIVVGLSANCSPVAGRFVANTKVVEGQWGATGLFFFDITAGRWILHSGPRPSLNGSEISTFPSVEGLCLNASNNLGIGTLSPGYKGDLVGTFRATTLMNSGGTVTSDERIKVGILPLDGLGLWEIWTELQAISFLYKPDFSFLAKEVSADEQGNEVVTEVPQKWPLPQGIQYGWSAQKIREYLPELVTEDPQSGILYLNREALFPIFQSAATAKLQQLEETIAQKDTLLTQLQSAIESLTTRVEALENAAA